MKKFLPFTFLFIHLVINSANAISNSATLLAHYPFSGDVLDQSGNGLNGEAEGVTFTKDRFGNDNAALSFNGENSFIDLGNTLNNEFSGTGKKFSVSVWVQPGSSTTDNMIVGKSSDAGCNENNRQWFIRLYQGKVEFEFYGDLYGETGRFIGGENNITDPQKWYHIVVTYDGSIDAEDGLERVSIYVDNRKENLSFARTSVGSLGDIQSGKSHLGIGALVSPDGEACGSHFFNGKIDDLKIFQGVLSKCEISDLYTSLIADYPFSGNANDNTANGYNGTVTNAELVVDRFGTDNSAYDFNGLNSFIDLGNVFNAELGGNGKKFSISVWIKPGKSTANNIIIGKNSDLGCSSNGRQWFLRLYEGKVNFEYFGDLNGGSGRFIGGGTLITDITKWYHIVVNYDGTVNSGDGLDRVAIFVNGVQESTSFVRPSVGSLGDIQDNGNAHTAIGSLLSPEGNICGSHVFKGVIDDIKIFRGTLDECQISELNVPGTVTGIPAILKTNESSLSVYPSPSTGFFQLKNPPELEHVKVVNSEGAEIFGYSISQNILNLSGFPSGIYFLKIFLKESVEVVKLVKID